MKKIRLYFGLLLSVALFAGCHDEYDDSALRSDVDDLKSRVEKLEAWCDTANGQISALQGIVSALDAKDYVTGVTPIMEGSKEIGYTITFTKSKPITIMHGAKGDTGAAGKDGVTPVIGVKQDTDGHYYWTVKIGTAAVTWMLDAEGNKIRTTGDKGEEGDKGHTPELSVAEFEGRLYWQIDGEWLLHDSQKVPATGDNGPQGDKGDAIFAEDGIDYESDPENVIFTLVDGTILTLPKACMVTIGFDSYEVFMVTPQTNTISIVLPAILKEADYTALIAELKDENGTDIDVVTRATPPVKLVKPTFVDGVYQGDAAVIITKPAMINGKRAVLKVTIVDKKGREVSATRVVEFYGNDLIAAIQNGGEFTLTQEYTVDSPLAIAVGKKLELDLNGKKISNTGTGFAMQVEGELIIDGEGVVNGGSGGDNQAIHVQNGGKLIVNSGSYNVGGDANGLGNSCIESEGGTIEIYGGTFQSEKAYNGRYYVLNQINDNPGTITVYGGTFINYDPSTGDDKLGVSFVAPGYTSVKISDAPATYKVVKGQPVTSTDNLTDAIAAAIEDGSNTVTLMQTMTLTGETVTLDGGASISRSDAGGVAFEGAPLYIDSKNTVVKNITFANGTQTNQSAIYVSGNKGRENLTFENCTFRNAAWDAIQLTEKELKTVIFKNCYFKNDRLSPLFNNKPNSTRYIHLETNSLVDTKVEITGCTFENVSKKYCYDSAITLYGYAFANLTIENNYVKGDGADKLTSDIIWISDGVNDAIVMSVEEINAKFIYRP